MNSKLIRADGPVVDRWPILLAFALYLVAFGIFVLTQGMLIAVA
jgi:hypothetical protein